METVKQILITEEQLKRVLREEFCSFSAAKGDDNFEGFMEGLKLCLELSNVSDRIINRLFHKEVE